MVLGTQQSCWGSSWTNRPGMVLYDTILLSSALAASPLLPFPLDFLSSLDMFGTPMSRPSLFLPAGMLASDTHWHHVVLPYFAQADL